VIVEAGSATIGYWRAVARIQTVVSVTRREVVEREVVAALSIAVDRTGGVAMTAEVAIKGLHAAERTGRAGGPQAFASIVLESIAVEVVLCAEAIAAVADHVPWAVPVLDAWAIAHTEAVPIDTGFRRCAVFVIEAGTIRPLANTESVHAALRRCAVFVSVAGTIRPEAHTISVVAGLGRCAIAVIHAWAVRPFAILACPKVGDLELEEKLSTIGLDIHVAAAHGHQTAFVRGTTVQSVTTFRELP
jgi:hypothetical protein